MTAETFTPSATTSSTTSVNVTMTPAAVAHVRKQLDKNPDAKGIRLGIRKSGCSGFKYETEWVSEPGGDDQIFTVDDVDIYVASEHLPMVNGIEIDFIREGINSLFQFRNPNATAECGCGESFAIS